MVKLIRAIFAILVGFGVASVCQAKPTTRLVTRHKVTVHGTRRSGARVSRTTGKGRVGGKVRPTVVRTRVWVRNRSGHGGHMVLAVRRTRYVEHFTASSFADNLTLG